MIATPTLAQQVNGDLGSASATTTLLAETAPTARSEIGGVIQRERRPVEGVVGVARGAAQRCAQRIVDHNRRRRLRRTEHVRRRHPHAQPGPHSQRGDCATQISIQPHCAR